MSDKVEFSRLGNSKEQEALMQEVLDGLEEITTMLSYDPWPGEFEIIAIYHPSEHESTPGSENIVVKAPAEKPKAQVISYEEWKALLRLSA